MSNNDLSRKKMGVFDYVRIFVMIVLIFVFLFSLYKIVDYYLEGKREKDFNESLLDSAVTPVEPQKNETKTEDENKTLAPFDENLGNPGVLFYPDISVDVKKLIQSYPDIVGWLYCPGTPINYPVVQGTDNAFYVHHLPNKRENAAGSLFMDFRDPRDLSDFCHVIYGHNMKNDSMFGTILDYKKAGYFEEHPYLFFFTEEKTYRLEIFAGVNTLATSWLYIEPDLEKRQSFLDFVVKRSTFQSAVKVSTEDHWFLLSTCSGALDEPNRYVIFAKLVDIS